MWVRRHEATSASSRRERPRAARGRVMSGREGQHYLQRLRELREQRRRLLAPIIITRAVQAGSFPKPPGTSGRRLSFTLFPKHL